MNVLGIASGVSAANAIKNALNAVKKTKSSSGGSSGSSGTIASAAKGLSTTANSTGQNSTTGKSIADFQKAYNDAKTRGDTAGMQQAHAGAEAIRKAQGYTGGADGSGKTPISYRYTDSNGDQREATNGTDYASQIPGYLYGGNFDTAQTLLDQRAQKMNGQTDTWQSQMQSTLDRAKTGGYVADFKSRLNNALSEYSGNAQAVRDEIAAKVKQQVNELKTQKDTVKQAGKTANAAAQAAYYQTVNPNGTGAEQRAALGLSNSGLTETAQLSAANQYAGSVNSNAQNVANQLNQIDLAIQNAKLTGDMTTAQQLQSYYETVLNAGTQNASSILSANQWAINNDQSNRQQIQSNNFTQAGLTGRYNDNQTLEGQRARLEFESMSTENKLAQLNLEIQQKYGMSQAAAELYLTQMQAQGQSLDNIYKGLQNTAAKTALGQ